MTEVGRFEEALKTLHVAYGHLLSQLVDKVLDGKDLLAGDLPFEYGGGFALAEIEDQFAMRLVQLRQLMIELSTQLQPGGATGRPAFKVQIVWGTKRQLNKRINRRLAKLRPAVVMDIRISKVSDEDGFVATIIYADRPPRGMPALER